MQAREVKPGREVVELTFVPFCPDITPEHVSGITHDAKLALEIVRRVVFDPSTRFR